MSMHGWLVGTLVVLGGLLDMGTASASDALAVADGMRVTIEYRLSLTDHTVVETNVGEKPLTYMQGAREIVPGLERQMLGMTAGQSKRIEVSAVEGFGAYNKKARVTVERSRVPADVAPGMLLQSAVDGRPVKVLEVNETSVVLDLNHPLAGKNLVYDVNVLNVERPESGSPPADEK